MSIRKIYVKMIERFLDGPEWYYVPSLERLPRNYRSPTVALAAWIYALYIRLFTMPGRFLIPAAALIVLYSGIALDSPIRILSIMLLVLFGIDFFCGMFFRPKLNIKRQVPERVRAGSKFTVTYELRNKRRFTAWDIELDNYKSKEGVNWLSHAETGAVPNGYTTYTQAELEAVRRGKYILHSPIADSKFPIGLFKWSCSLRDARDMLLVYPSFHPLNNLTLPVGMKYQKEGVSRVSKVGESMDFFGCREFREGDDPRHIDWPGSARSGEIIIKEFQEEYLSRIALIVDTYVPGMKSFRLFKPKKQYSEELESALSLTAALTDYLTRGEYIVDIFAAGTQVYHFKAGRHLTCFDGILDILACLEPNKEHPISRLSGEVLEEISGIGSAVVILLGWDREREELVDRLRNCGTAVKAIIIEDGVPLDIPADMTVVSIDDIKNGRIVNL
jgi:uncharacterized protein (DUF58 family)